MNVAQLRTLARTLAEDTVPDGDGEYQLSDAVFLIHLNEAQEEACIRKKLIFDKSSAFCSIVVSSGTETYSYDDSIVAIKHASITDASGTITKLNITDRLELDRLSSDWREQTETPENMIVDDTTVELSPIPDASYTLNLECYTLPQTELVNDSDEPEIHRVHHKSLVFWVLHRFYDTPDADTFNANKAAIYEAKFERVFGKRPSATWLRDQYSNMPHRNKVCL